MASKKMHARDTFIRLLVLRNKDKTRIDKRERRKGKGYKKNVDSLNTVNLVCFFFFFFFVKWLCGRWKRVVLSILL